MVIILAILFGIAATTQFNLTVQVQGILPATNGGTNNAYFQVSGPASSTKTYTFPNASATIPQTIASGTSAMPTSAISTRTCASAVSTSATNVATTDSIRWSFNSDPGSTTGYSSGNLVIYPYPTSGYVNFRVCNNYTSSITPGSATLNWEVIR